MEPIYSMKGVQDLLEVYEDKVTITPKGFTGLVNKGLKGTKTIPFVSISAVQFKKSGWTSGYLQFTLTGGIESRGGVFEATKDENTFMFAGAPANIQAEKIRAYIEGRMHEMRSQPMQAAAPVSVADELSKLAGLKEKGVLSEAEFQEAKRRLIGA